MKKLLLFCITICGLYLSSIARPVNQETAQNIAAKFMGTDNLQLAATYRTEQGATAFYVFNTADGFVIVSADDCETPIIGYSHEGSFDPNNVPVQMEDYLQDFVNRIQYGIQNQVETDEITARQWELIKTSGRLNESKATNAVAPLLTAKWHQGCLYNSLCPSMNGPCDHAEVGCVAVAMGQIMHYWRHPTTGCGSHSYSNAGTTLSADFGNTTYDWDHMPDSLTDASTETEIEAVATLLYHCGVAVDMYYTINGSGANSIDVPKAMRRYFKYSRLAHREKQSDYNNEEWLAMLKHDLDLQHPVFYLGSGNQGSHAFVCDGYDDNDLLHFNWGWGTANGYFALGNLTPNGYAFNDNNYAIFDIIPQYEPCCLVVADALPSTAGTIEGTGEYHFGEQCTLTAIPTEGYRFFCWKKNGQVISDLPTFTLTVEEDTINIEAFFSCYPVGQIAANYDPDENNPNSPNVKLSWSPASTEWALLKQIDLNEDCSAVATDGEYIFVAYAPWSSPSFAFGKYTMSGDLVERFNINDNFDAVSLGYDGTSFYCNTFSKLNMLFQVDLDNKTIIDSLQIGDNNNWFSGITYDSEYDGFWLYKNNQARLYDRQGHILQTTPTLPDYIFGSGYYSAKDGSPHLIITRESGVYNYDITNNFISDQPVLDQSWDYTYGMGACTGKYDGKDAMFIINDLYLFIYEIKSRFEQIAGYRIYRADNEGNAVTIADNVPGVSYIDYTWNDAHAGEYRFGISEVYANGIESEIIWTEFIEKTDYGVGEGNDDSTSSSVQKVFENGQIIIIKDGKRYNVAGQLLN